MSEPALLFAPPQLPHRHRFAWLATLLAVLLAFLTGAAGTVLFLRMQGKALSSAPVRLSAAGTAAAAPPSADPATLQAREDGLATRLQILESRANAIDDSSRTAAGYASKAEALMTVLAARRALDRGQPLGYLEGQLRDRFGDRRPEAVQHVIDAGHGPVTTLGDLQAALDALAPQLIDANPDEGWWQVLRHRFDDLVVLRHGDSPSPRPADRLRRARQALDLGQVGVALAEVERMPGADNGKSWTEAARCYDLAQQGLSELEESVLTQPVPPPIPLSPTQATPGQAAPPGTPISSLPKRKKGKTVSHAWHV